MKKLKIWIICVIGLGLFGCSTQRTEEIPYTTADWDAELWGNHRVVLKVESKSDAVAVRVPWRRRDLNPQEKRLAVVSRATGESVRNTFCYRINREFGEIIFQPEAGPGEYYLYYLINQMTGRSNYPTVIYPEPELKADSDWLSTHGIDNRDDSFGIENFPMVRILEIQSIDELNSFYPMELIATAEEIENLLKSHPNSGFLLFSEDRQFPIRMTDDLPYKWIKIGPRGRFEGKTFRGEYYAFQIGVYAARFDIEELKVEFEPLESGKKSNIISSEAFSSFNTAGTDWTGREFEKPLSVSKGKIQALWCGIQIPLDISPGEYRGSVSVSAKSLPTEKVELRISVSPEIRADSGDDEPWRHSRLRWLDSQIAMDDEVVPPYTPLIIEDSQVQCLGRRVIFGDDGLPARITSFFTPEMTSIGDTGTEILAAPIRLILEEGNQRSFPVSVNSSRLIKQEKGTAAWEYSGSAGTYDIRMIVQMEFDGYLDYQLSVSSSAGGKLNDIRLEIPIRKSVAKYMMGMGVKGGLRPADFSWKWDQEKNQDSAWIGNVNAGFQCAFRDDRYSRPLNTNFYLRKPLVMPNSWWNQGKGGCVIRDIDEGTVLLKAYSGPRDMEPGEIQHYYFSLLLTPFHPLNTKNQWNTRYYHRYEPLDKISASGANTINVHHATEINPFINYPFLRPQEMKDYIDKAHEADMKVKIYYTVRELTNRAAEFFALRSLGDEIFFPGRGGGFSWLQEHLNGDYIAAWFVPSLKDAAIINSGVSRWHNYYVEGLNWLVNNVGIDGLYIDDVAFDRTTMKRVRKILSRNRPGSMIDLHSANQFNVRDGFANSANLYLEHFPYIDRLWFGEYFDYGSAPDFWMVEISGIPFGLMGEMLQDGGNPWRGLLYGMTSRLPWAGDPTPIWKLWNEFGIAESSMIGYWVPSSPVRTTNQEVPVTIYRKSDSILIALASWADTDVFIGLNFDWKSLDVDKDDVVLQAPAVGNMQSAASYSVDDRFFIEKDKGMILILKYNEDI